jgi:hypothetical protein
MVTQKKTETNKVATHEGILTIGETNFNVAVLKDGTRLLTGRSILAMMDRPYKGQYQDELPAFVRGKNLLPYISPAVRETLEPIPFKTIKGSIAKGFKAEILPELCDIYINANKGEALSPMQIPVAQKCEIILRALARIGIIGLIDEATGYQDVRDRQALQKILELYLRDEYAKWSKRFPDDFYRELFRLRGWKWHSTTSQRPQCIGNITNEIVYSRLPPGILEELKERNPKNAVGNRKVRHHQFLSDNIGLPELEQHLHATLAFMRISSNWNNFMGKFNQAFPKRGVPNQLELFFEDEE